MSKKPIDLYYGAGSPVCRLVNIVATELSIPINLIHMDGFTDIFKPEYLKVNPQHKMPSIVDNGFVLWESRAIIAYLVNKYAPNHPLYPTDPETRGKIDAILHFDNGLLFQQMEAVCFPTFYTRCEGSLTTEQTFAKHLKKFDFMVKGKKYLVGDRRTLADLSVMTTLTYLESYPKVANILAPFPNITKWLKNLKEELPYYEELIQKPIEETKGIAKFMEDEEMFKKAMIEGEAKVKSAEEFLDTINPTF